MTQTEPLRTAIQRLNDHLEKHYDARPGDGDYVYGGLVLAIVDAARAAPEQARDTGGLREALEAALTDEVMRDVLVVLPPPVDFTAYATEVRTRLVDAVGRSLEEKA